ncbi:hypothetical protein FB559_2876 [Actinoallomurus bryophytorum]|uniref:Uncharacterized protein n=1 Tax=Actinoallomurus bryophytorum TaxID=1490222 RepID=A0A543CK72_9ACTN|nr:hypothetical protein [Actinoallomurus bryophytorum]TQL97297.1 hypothetical protein FB559_2876 [Actinoallomurus bryophytorum]
MAINVYMSGDQAEQELRSLFAWLQQESSVRRQALLSLESTPPAAGEMGGVLEGIKVVADEGFQAANFAIAYASWRATRSKRPKVTIKQAGIEITLDDADPETVEKIVTALKRDAP